MNCICSDCLSLGALEELEICTNEAIGGVPAETDIIQYRTPSLPTWQDTTWPCIDGIYCKFERMAAKSDFKDITEFGESLFPLDRDGVDIEWLWEAMPLKRIKNHLDGNFNTSVYLFTNKDKKHCIWDSN